MALIFADSFDSYSETADLTTKWDVNNSTSYNVFNSTAGRFGGGCLVCGHDDYWLNKGILLTGGDPGTNDIIVSFSFMATSFTRNSYSAFLQLNQSGDFSDGALSSLDGIGLAVVGTTLTAYRGYTSFVTGTTELVLGSWYRIEVRLATNNSGGVLQVWINGVLDIDFTGDTYDSGKDGINVVKFGGQNTDGDIYIDDVLIYDITGDAPNDVLGDIRMETLRPTGDGDENDGTPSSGTDHYAMVDEDGVNDGDSTYVSMSTAGDKELYDIGSLSYTPVKIHGVVVNLMARVDGTTPRTMKAKVKSATTEGDGDTLNIPYGDTYKPLQACFTEDPSTGAAWTTSGVDDMQIGQEVVA